MSSGPVESWIKQIDEHVQITVARWKPQDYLAKRHQYEDLGVPEYWMVAPQVATVLIFKLQGETY